MNFFKCTKTNYSKCYSCNWLTCFILAPVKKYQRPKSLYTISARREEIVPTFSCLDWNVHFFEYEVFCRCLWFIESLWKWLIFYPCFVGGWSSKNHNIKQPSVLRYLWSSRCRWETTTGTEETCQGLRCCCWVFIGIYFSWFMANVLHFFEQGIYLKRCFLPDEKRINS